LDIFISKHTVGVVPVDGILPEQDETFIIKDLSFEDQDLKNGDVCVYQGYEDFSTIVLINKRNDYKFKISPSYLKRV
jgi:regulation of enolase protein 1 (concanavalin A-like superfamily)